MAGERRHVADDGDAGRHPERFESLPAARGRGAIGHPLVAESQPRRGDAALFDDGADDPSEFPASYWKYPFTSRMECAVPEAWLHRIASSPLALSGAIALLARVWPAA